MPTTNISIERYNNLTIEHYNNLTISNKNNNLHIIKKTLIFMISLTTILVPVSIGHAIINKPLRPQTYFIKNCSNITYQSFCLKIRSI